MRYEISYAVCDVRKHSTVMSYFNLTESSRTFHSILIIAMGAYLTRQTAGQASLRLA